jgi:hypothetical protein
MKAKSIVIAIGMMLAVSAWADEPKADAAAPADTSAPVAMSMPMPADDAAPAQFQKMDKNLDKMHTLVGQMKDAKGPAERQKLMMEYMTAQHENMMLARDAMGMGPGMGMGKMDGGMGGMGMMGKKDCDMDGMRGMGGMGMGPGMGKKCDMAKMGKRDCDCDDMRGMGMKGGGMGGMGMGSGMGMMGGMGGMKDDATAARIQSMEKRLDALQEMMKMMMNH